MLNIHCIQTLFAYFILQNYYPGIKLVFNHYSHYAVDTNNTFMDTKAYLNKLKRLVATKKF